MTYSSRNKSSRRSTWVWLAVMMLGGSAAVAQNTTLPDLNGEDEEDVRRYAVEIILFTYANSVSAGTEVFLPDVAEGLLTEDGVVERPETRLGNGDVPYYGDVPQRTGGISNGIDGSPDSELEDDKPGQRTDANAIESDREVDAEDDARNVPEVRFGEIPDDSLASERSADPSDDSPDDLLGELADEAEDALENEADGNIETELEEIVVGGTGVDFELLPTEALSMDGIHANLDRLDAYQPVLWSGWTQIVREKSESPALRLRRLGDLSLAIDGSLTLYVGRFVHLLVDATLEAPPDLPSDDDTQQSYGDVPIYSDESPAEFGRYGDPFGRRAAPPVIYRIQEDSIMRNGETRYFDHPKFGLIARLSLVEDDPNDEFDEDGEGLLPDLLPGDFDEDAPEPLEDPQLLLP